MKTIGQKKKKSKKTAKSVPDELEIMAKILYHMSISIGNMSKYFRLKNKKK